MDIREERALIPRKLAEAAFRNLWVLLLPMVLLPVTVILLARDVPTYVSGATIWTQPLEGVNSGPLSTSGSVYNTPAVNQVQVLNDLLATRTFRTDIAIAARLVSAGASERELNKAADYVLESVAVQAIGTNLVGLVVTTPVAADSYAIAVSFINEYQRRASEESTRDATVRIAYYEDQLTLAQAELDDRLADLNAYVTANPKVVDPDLTPWDATYERLKASVDQQNTLVQDLTSKRFEAELSVKSAEGAQGAVFTVQDPPRLATDANPVSIVKKLGLPLAAMGFGAFLAVGYLYVVFRLDQTIRTSEDLEGMGVPLLGYVPEIQKGPGAGAWQYTPFGWLMKQRQRGYARKVAASIASIPVQEGRM